MKWLVIMAIIALTCSAALGEATTQPSAAETAWKQTVSEFATSVNSMNASLVEPYLTKPASIRSFDTDTKKPLHDLLAFAGECAVLGSHAYLKMPTELAADMAEDFKNIADLDENVRKQMIPSEGAMTRANTTASQWLMKTLEPKADEPVAVLVLRLAEVPVSKDAESANSPALFILLKGEASGKTYRIKAIVYGNPLEPGH